MKILLTDAGYIDPSPIRAAGHDVVLFSEVEPVPAPAGQEQDLLAPAVGPAPVPAALRALAQDHPGGRVVGGQEPEGAEGDGAPTWSAALISV